MSVLLRIPTTDPSSDDLLALLGAGALGRVESSATGGGAGFAELGTFPVTVGAPEYLYPHLAGTADTYYRWRFTTSANASPTGYSPEIQGYQTEGSTAPNPTGHCYPSLGQFKAYLVDNSTDYGNVSDDRLLRALLTASRKVDAHVQRGAGFGFGPRIVTRRYDAPRGAHRDVLRLGEDFLTLTSVSVAPSAGSSATTYVDETDFYREPFDTTPFRALRLLSGGQGTWYDTARGITVVGKVGLADTHEAIGALSSAITTTTATSLLMTTEPSPGNTLLIDSEQLFVRAVDPHDAAGWDVTVVRGANGTTAATHLTAVTVEVYVYAAEATDCALALAQRAVANRNSGGTGDFGGAPGVPTIAYRETERSVLREFLWPYTLVPIS